MRAQLGHLIKAVSEPHVTLQVIPFSAGAYPGMPGLFVLMDFPHPADPDVVHVDTMAGDLFLEKARPVRGFLAQEHQVKR